MTRPAAPPTREAAVRLLPLASFTSTLDRFAFAPLLAVVAADFGVPLGRVTMAATLYYLGYGLSQVVWGMVSDRLGRIRTIRLTLLAAGLVGLAAALAWSVPALVVTRAIQGALFAGAVPTALVYMGDAFPVAERQRPLSALFSGSALATALAAPLAGAAADLVSWRVAFLAPAVVAVGLAVALRRLRDPPREGRTPSPVAGLRATLSDRWALLVLALVLCEGACILVVVTFLSPALQADGASATAAGLATAAYGVGALAGSRVVALLGRRLAAPWMIALGAALAVAGITVVATGVTIPSVVVAGVCVGLGFPMVHTNLQVWATDVTPRTRATAVSLFAAGLFAGSGLGTAALTPLADAGRFATLFAIAAVGMVPVGLVAAVGRGRYDRRD